MHPLHRELHSFPTRRSSDLVGILAAIALPAYQDYVIRSKMSEAIAAIAACKTSVAEYSSSHTAYPVESAEASSELNVPMYVACSVALDSIITATSQNTGASP